MEENIILIGMPGSGKSTIGRRLAEILSYRFIDTDILIEQRQGTTLQEIVDRQGYLTLRKIEEAVLLSLRLHCHVIATGGSAVYSARAMEHLQRGGITVFLNVDLMTLLTRIDNFTQRGIARRPGQSFEDLYRERFPLYAQVADLVIDTARLTPEAACREIMTRVISLLRGEESKKKAP